MGYLRLALCTICYLGFVSCSTTILPDVIEDVTTIPEEVVESAVLNEESETTELPTTTAGSTLDEVKVAFSNIGCVVEGKRYFEGQYLPNVGGICSACYCLKGEAKCEEVKCKAIPSDCRAIKKPGICCAVDYECEGKDKSTTSEITDKLPKDRDILLGVKDSIFHILGIERVQADEEIAENGEIITNQVRTNRQNRIEEGDFGEKNTPTELPIIEEITEIITEVPVEPVEEKIEIVTDDKTVISNEPPMDTASEKIISLAVTAPKEEEKDIIVTTEKITKPEVLIAAIPTTVLPKAEPEPEPEPIEKLEESPPTEEPNPETPLPLTTKLDDIIYEDNLAKVLDAALLPEYDENYDYEYILDEDYDEAYIDSELPILITNDKNIPDIQTAKPVEEDFPTYDINVGTSIIAGDKEPSGVGQVIPVDLHSEKISTTAEPPQETPASSFLDSILNLFAASTAPEEPPVVKKEFVPEEDTSFVLGPLRPPTVRLRPVSGSKPGNKNMIDDSGAGLSPPPFLKSVDSKPSRNDFPIRRPSVNGERRPGLLPRPKFPISQPPSKETTDKSLPTKPLVENGFEAVNDNIEVFLEEKNEDMKKTNVHIQPTLPPSLPNLQIIPFVASDALKKKEKGSSLAISSREILPERKPHRPRHDIAGKRPSIGNHHFPGRRPTLPHRKEHVPSKDLQKGLQKDSHRHKNLRKPHIHRPKPVDKKEIKESGKSKPHSRSDLPPLFGRPFRNRTGIRPPFVPPRRPFRPEGTFPSKPSIPKHERTHSRPDLRTRLDRPTPSMPEKSKPKPEIPILPIDAPISEMAPQEPSPFKIKDSHINEKKAKATEEPPISAMPEKDETEKDEKVESEFVFPFEEENGGFLPPNLKLPKPISTSGPAISDDIINLVLQDKFKMRKDHASPNVLFDRQKPSMKSKLNEVTTTPLPEIPDSVKNQLPLGNYPILSAGLFELAGCNVYGRMYDIGNQIKELSAKCKECRCTPVGVQCLPMC